MQLVDRLGGELPRGAVTVELDDIQATVLRYRPEPYYGTHVMLHVDDAQAGREFVRRLTPHVDSAADWWQAGEAWISVAISYTGLVALGLPEDSLRSFPEAFRVGMAARADKLRDYGPNDPDELGAALRHRGDPHRGQRLQRLRRRPGATRCETARQQYQGFAGRHRADDAGLRRPAGRPQPAGLQGLDRSARHRGQRRRAVARSGTTDQGRRVHPRLSRRGRRAAADAPPGRAGTQRHVRRAAQVPVAGRDVQPVPARARRDRAGAGAARGEAGGPLAQRRAADARARRRTTRRSAQTRAATTTSPMPPIRTAGRCRSARTCGA